VAEKQRHEDVTTVSVKGSKTPNILPEATDHPGLHALISNAALQAFARLHHSDPVPQEASGTEVRKCTRLQARLPESIEPQAGSSTRPTLRLSTGEKGGEGRRNTHEKIPRKKKKRGSTAEYSDQNRNTIGHRAGSSSRGARLSCIVWGGSNET